jgi:hypothetical protein
MPIDDPVHHVGIENLYMTQPMPDLNLALGKSRRFAPVPNELKTSFSSYGQLREHGAGEGHAREASLTSLAPRLKHFRALYSVTLAIRGSGT